jgi:hypothetical protein
VNWLGDLWHVPFRVEVWGTAAEWGSAIATGAAFLIAALVYAHDANLSRSSQAELVHTRILGEPIGDKVRVLVENYSPNSVFFLRIELRRIGLWKAVKLDSSEDFLTGPDPSKHAVREMVKKTSDLFSTIPVIHKFDPRDAERLEAGGSYEFSVSRISAYQDVYLTFTDAKGRPWEFGDLASDRPKLRKASKSRSKRGSIRVAFYRSRHPWRAQREFRTRVRSRGRTFIEELKITFIELVIKALDDEKVKTAFREVIDDKNIKSIFGDAFRKALAREIELRNLEVSELPESAESVDRNGSETAAEPTTAESDAPHSDGQPPANPN